jgi:hypothetical protein
LEFRFAESDTHGFLGAGEVVYCPVALDGQHTSSIDFKEGKNMIYNDHGIRIAVLTDADEYGNRYVTVINNSDEDISLDLLSVTDGKEVSSEIYTGIYFSDAKFKAHTRGACKLSAKAEDKKISFRILIYNFTEDELLFTADQITTLKK